MRKIDLNYYHKYNSIYYIYIMFNRGGQQRTIQTPCAASALTRACAALTKCNINVGARSLIST